MQKSLIILLVVCILLTLACVAYADVIIEPENSVFLSAVTSGSEVHGYIVYTDTRVGTDYSFIGDVYTRVEYRLFDPDGQVIKKDLGILMYDEVSGYAYVQGTDYFAWISKTGETLISIPSMAYSFD